MAGRCVRVELYNELNCSLTPFVHPPGLRGQGLRAVPPLQKTAFEIVVPSDNANLVVSYKVEMDAQNMQDAGTWLVRLHIRPQLQADAVFRRRDDRVVCTLFDQEWRPWPHSAPSGGRWIVRYNTELSPASFPIVTEVSMSKKIPGPAMRNSAGRVVCRRMEGEADKFVLWGSETNPDDDDPYADRKDARCVGSNSPVAVDLASDANASLDLTVHVPEGFLGVPFRIRGEKRWDDGTSNSFAEVISTNGGQLVCYAAAGPHRLQAAVTPPWKRNNLPWGLAGDIFWKLHIEGTKRDYHTGPPSRLEFYALNGRLPKFFRNIIPVALARTFVLGYRNPDWSWEQHCAVVAFRDLSFQYDRSGRKARFFESGAFFLESYLKNVGTGSTVNCFDQAGIMQICMGLSPSTAGACRVVASTWGRIKTTALVGQGECNNPIVGDGCKRKICLHQQRCSYFPCHCFVALKDGNVVDACCGPYIGKTALREFLDGSIDEEETSYPKLEWYSNLTIMSGSASSGRNLNA